MFVLREFFKVVSLKIAECASTPAATEQLKDLKVAVVVVVLVDGLMMMMMMMTATTAMLSRTGGCNTNRRKHQPASAQP